MDMEMDTSFDEEEATKEEHEYFGAFKKAIDEGDEVQIHLLIRKEGFLRKYFHLDNHEIGTFIAVAAERGTIKIVWEMYQLVPDIVKFKGCLNQTPIFYAIKNSPEMVNFFIENGADVNALDLNGETPLLHAIKYSAEVVKVLLHNGANVDVADKFGVSLLHQALFNGTQETLRLLLNTMLSKLQIDYEEAETSEEIVRKILLNKDVLKIVKKDIPLLILFAAKVGSDDVFKMMLNEIEEHFDLMQNNPENACRDPVNLNIGGYYKRTALHHAIRQQLPEVVRFLLRTGADVNCKTGNKLLSPLHYAAALENEEICKILLSFGADLNYTSPDLGSPLYQVCGCSSLKNNLMHYDGYYYEGFYDCRFSSTTFNLKIMKLLLENGADPNLPADMGDTPFFEACKGGIVEPLETLLEFGADLKILNEIGNSALHFAALGNSLEIVHFLLEKGFDINIKNKDFSTPLLLLMKQGRPEFLEMVEYLVNHGADINFGDAYNDMTALHFASIYFESMELVEGLLELGADWKIEHNIDLSWNSNMPNFGCGRKLLISFIALNEKKLGNYINCYFEHNVEELLEAFEYFKRSRLEVEKLKSSKIFEGRTVSFYDFLTGSVYNTVQVVKNDQINNVFKSRKYFTEFPCYWFLLQKRFERIVVLMEAVDKMTDFLTNSLSPLPTLIIRQILNSLESSDFKFFDASLSASNRLNEPTVDPKLPLDRFYDSKIVEIRQTGVMVTLLEYPNIQPTLLLYSQMKTETIPNPEALDLKVGGEIRVMYVGRYPQTGKIRLTGKIV